MSITLRVSIGRRGGFFESTTAAPDPVKNDIYVITVWRGYGVITIIRMYHSIRSKKFGSRAFRFRLNNRLVASSCGYVFFFFARGQAAVSKSPAGPAATAGIIVETHFTNAHRLTRSHRIRVLFARDYYNRIALYKRPSRMQLFNRRDLFLRSRARARATVAPRTRPPPSGPEPPALDAAADDCTTLTSRL